MELQSVTRLIQVLRQLGRTDGHETLSYAELVLVAEALHRVHTVEVYVVVRVDTV
jgi:hypothetical protein